MSIPRNSHRSTPSGFTNFESFCRTVYANLKAVDEVQPMTHEFSKLNSSEERIRFVLEKKLDSVLELGPNNSCNFLRKNKEEAQRLRNFGNQIYQKNRFSEALDIYSQSICLSPHPLPPNFLNNSVICDNDVNTYEELALGYANRSAVLFQMKLYDLCVNDITRAFDHSYPNNLMYKLFERKAQCMKALRDYPRALESLKNAAMWMNHSSLSEPKSVSFNKGILKQIDNLSQLVEEMSVSQFVAKSKDGPNLPEVPQLPSMANKQMPGVDPDLKLVYSRQKGRHFVATRDILPGEILIVETPYSSILSPEFYNTHCQTCYQRLIAPIPCWSCSAVRFCCKWCRKQAWDRFHKVECQQLGLIMNSAVGNNGILALRILTSSGKIYLEYVIDKLRSSKQDTILADDECCRLGFNDESVYDAADYRTIHTLVTNEHLRNVGDLFRRALMALYLLRVLERTPFFYNGGSDSRNIPLNDLVSVGSILMCHVQNLPCNAHSIAELSEEGVPQEIGAAVYGILSLLNHSCDPNIVRHNYGADAVVRSIKKIANGEEVVDNYGYHYALMIKSERKSKLNNQYFFDCDCLACQQDWPLYPDIPRMSLDDATPKAMDDVLKGINYAESLPLLWSHLELLENRRNLADKYPVKEINDCQEAIKQCLAIMSNNCYNRTHKANCADGNP